MLSGFLVVLVIALGDALQQYRPRVGVFFFQLKSNHYPNPVRWGKHILTATHMHNIQVYDGIRSNTTQFG